MLVRMPHCGVHHADEAAPSATKLLAKKKPERASIDALKPTLQNSVARSRDLQTENLLEQSSGMVAKIGRWTSCVG